MSVPGGHVSGSGSGMGAAVAGFGILDVLTHATGDAMEFRQWQTRFEGAGISAAEIDKAKAAAWANALTNPNAGATQSFGSIFEMMKVFPQKGEKGPSLDEAIHMLPTFSGIMTGLQSIKSEGIHNKFSSGRQIYDLAKGIEETGVTQRGTPEERERNTKHMMNELFKTMLSERGVTDGSSFYAMTNNSGGAAQNWDKRMATVVAPVLSSIMKHSRLGNADYMGLRTFQQGTITPKAVQALLDYGAIDVGDTYTDKAGVHLKANTSPFEGMEKNLWDWSGGFLSRLQSHGLDISNQEKVNKFINAAGSNKTTTGLLRALLEPATRSQIEKDMWVRDQVPDNALGILQAGDPGLKLDAFGKAIGNFMTALGGGLVDPAIATLNGLTLALNKLASVAKDHPTITQVGALAGAAGGVGLLGYGGGRMLGLFGSGAKLEAAAVALTNSAAALDTAAVRLGGSSAGGLPGSAKAKGMDSTVGKLLTLYPLAAIDAEMGVGQSPHTGLRGILDRVIDPGLADRIYGDKPWPSLIGAAHAADAVTNTSGNALHEHDNDLSPLYREGLRKLADAAASTGLKLGALDTSASALKVSFDGLVGTLAGLKLGGDDHLAGGAGSDDLSGPSGGVMRHTRSLRGGGAGGAIAALSASSGGVGGSFRARSNNPVAGQARESYDFWRGKGLSHVAALAMVAQEEGETSFDPRPGDFLHGHPTAFGSFQFHGDRAAKILAGTGIDVRSRGLTHLQQLEAAWFDGTKGGRPGFFNRLNQISGRDAAADFATKVFEGPLNLAKDQRIRRTIAEGYDHFGSWHGRTPTVSAPPPRKVTPGSASGNAGDITAAVSKALGRTHMAVKVSFDDRAKKHVAHFVEQEFENQSRFPTAVGGPDTYGHWHGPATPLEDVP